MTVAETLVAGRYRLGPSLGAGGMGRVWLARDEVLRRDVAIKEIALPFGLTDDEREEMRQRTLREARAAARLSHPNVVRIYDVQHGDERPWIVMEYVPARSLLQVIKESGPLPVDQAAGIGLGVLSALDAAYRVGVVHRDVKPSNVLIADDGRVLLTDFGSAMIDEKGEGALTQTGIILGSPRYIAPERAATGVSSLESDLWSLGATLYEAVEGRAPYTRETTLATLVALATEKPDPVERAGPLKPVINGLLQKKPEARMRLAEVEERLRRIADVQSAVWLHSVPAPRVPEQATMTAEVVERLDQLALSAAAADERPQPVKAAMPPAPPALPSRTYGVPRRRRRWGVVAAAAATVAAVLAGTAALAFNGGSLPWSKRQGLTFANAAPDNGPSPAASATPSAPTARPTVLPAGFKWYDSKSGFHVAWPDTWTKVQESGTSITLCAPGGPPFVAVRDWARSDPDLTAAFRREETAASLSAYKRLRTEVFPQQDGAEREYTYTDPKMGPLHGLDRVVIEAGRAYFIQWVTPAAKWAEHRAKLDVVLGTFRAAAPVAAVPADALPRGYSWYKSKSGFQMAAPAKWTKLEETPTSVLYCAPGGPPLVAVRAWAPYNVDLMVALSREEELGNLPRYKRVSLELLPGQQGAVWEYTFTDPRMGPLHGLERVFLTSNGAYLVQWRTPAAKWAANLGQLGMVTSSFRTVPVGGINQRD